jgi:Activator of Hsp90 ATPase, N-terminal
VLCDVLYTTYNNREMTATFGVGDTTNSNDTAAAPDLNALAGLGVKLSTATGTVYKVEKIEGDASVVTVRGKRRYLFDYSLTLKWRIEVRDNTCSVMLLLLLLGCLQTI